MMEKLFGFRFLISFSFLILLMVFSVPKISAQTYNDDSFTPEVMIDIGYGLGRKHGIAIPDFEPIKTGKGTDANASYLPGRLAKNLDMTGMFENIDRRAFIDPDKRAGIDNDKSLNYPLWSKIGADFLIKGGIQSSGSKITMELRLYDVALGKQILGKKYSGSAKERRSMINRFTNEVILAITGEPGVFGSKIAFVTGTRSNRSIMLTELGSDVAETIAGHKNGPSTQPTMGFGNKMAWIHRNGPKWELLVNGKVVSSGPTHLSPAFKPDGSVAVALSGNMSTNIHLVSGKSKSAITNNSGINISPTFSPDGGRMAYVSDQAGNAQIYIGSAGGGGGSRLTGGSKSTDPAWSPKGDLIAFVSRETDICVIRPDGSGMRQLTGGQGVNHRPSFSPDGRLIVFSSTRGGKQQLYIMTVNGDKQQPLITEYGANQELPYWSPEMPKE